MAKPTRNELDAELREAKSDREAAEAKLRSTLLREGAGVRAAIASAIVTGGFLLTNTLITSEPEQVVDNCIEQRTDAVEMAKELGTWTPLPEDAELEDQCDINTYVVQWDEDHPGEIEGTVEKSQED